MKVLEEANGSVMFHCEGCGFAHAVNVDPAKNRPLWGYNHNPEKPTFTPSILVRWPTPKGEAVCHSFVTDGNIQYLSDCTHKLAGQTIELTDMEL